MLEVLFYLIVFLCTAKIDKLDHSPAGDHDVGSLDVSMDDGVGVKVVEGSGDLTSIVGYCTTVQRTKSVRKIFGTCWPIALQSTCNMNYST